MSVGGSPMIYQYSSDGGPPAKAVASRGMVHLAGKGYMHLPRLWDFDLALTLPRKVELNT